MGLALPAACGDHEPELSRVGGAENPEASVAACDDTLTGEFPCEVENVVRTRCQLCHVAEQPRPNDAPFSLATFDGTRALYSGSVVCGRMIRAIETGFMPLRGFAFLDPEGKPLCAPQKKILLDWLHAGALPRSGTGACETQVGLCADDCSDCGGLPP